MRRRLLIFPLPEYGHVSPTLPIASHYARMGCEVVYLTDPKFRAEIEAFHAGFVPLLPGETFASGQQVWTRLTPHGYPGERARVLTDRLKAVARESRWDLFLLDWLLVKSFGCDVASALEDKPRLYFSATLLPWKPRPIYPLDRELLVLCPGELEIARFRECGPAVHYVEPTYNEAPFAADGNHIPFDSRPLVLAAWGSQNSRYSALPLLLERIALLAQQTPGCLFVVATGSNPRARAALEAHPAPNLLYSESIEQRSLLQRAKAMLTHGGMSTIKECILNKVPMLIFPFLADQPMNAMRVTQAGVGAAIFSEEQSVSRIAQELDRALASAFQPGLDAMGQIFFDRLWTSPSHQLLNPFLI